MHTTKHNLNGIASPLTLHVDDPEDILVQTLAQLEAETILDSTLKRLPPAPAVKPERKEVKIDIQDQDEEDDDNPEFVTFHFAEPQPEEKPKPKYQPKQNYFKNFKKAEIDELIKKYKHFGIKNQEDLEKLLDKHFKTFKAFQYCLSIAISLNFGFIAFVATTGLEGLQAIVSLFSSTARVPTSIGVPLGIIMGILDVLTYMLVFLAIKEAVLCTLDHVLKEPETGKSFIRSLFDKIFEVALYGTNSLSMITVLLGFINMIPWGATLFLTAIVLTIGNFYMARYTNTEAREGLYQFFLGNKWPWLLKKFFCDRELSAVLQIGAESGSTIILLTLAYYLYLGTKTAQSFGVPLNTANELGIASAIMSLARTVPVYHTRIYKRYLKPPDDLRQLIAKDPAIATLLEKKEEKIAAKIKEAQQAVVSERGFFGLAKESPVGMVQTFFRSSVGIALTVFTILDPSLANILMLAACFIFSVAGAKANIDRNMNLAAIAKLERKEGATKALAPMTNHDKWVIRASRMLVLDSAACDMMNMLGAAPDISPEFKLFFLILAFDRMLTLMNFNGEKVEKTMLARFGSPEVTEAKEEKKPEPSHYGHPTSRALFRPAPLAPFEIENKDKKALVYA